MTELRCLCGASLLPGSLATVEYLNAWRAEHAECKAPEAPEVLTMRKKGKRVVVTVAKSAT